MKNVVFFLVYPFILVSMAVLRLINLTLNGLEDLNRAVIEPAMVKIYVATVKLQCWSSK
jgi:hypothetical protein